MSREIKFRAWDKDNKNMWFWHKFEALFVHSQSGTMRFENFYNKENIELMQFTGLKDKNGKEIYEGDIVYAHDWSDKCLTCDKKLYEEGNVTGEVTYQDGAYHIGGSNIWFTKNREVIGNIYENPEFLTKKKLRSEL